MINENKDIKLTDSTSPLSLGGTADFDLIQIGDEVFIEDVLDRSRPRLILNKQLANIYINQLQCYLDEDADNQEEARLYHMELFNNMCRDYFKEADEENKILSSL